MKKLVILFSVTVAVALGSLVSHGPAAPALGEKPIRWEFAELRYYRGLRANPAFAGQPGVPVNIPQVIARFTTADDEIEANEWDDLAKKLNAPAPKKEVTTTVHKLRVLKQLSADGWEVVDRSVTGATPGTDSWSLRRRVP
jgi:hypothetical protein